MKKVVEQIDPVGLAQAVGRLARHAQVLILLPAVGVGRDLSQQAGHQIDRGVQLGHFVQVHRHAPIILGAVQPHPGHGIVARHVVGIVGLMLMPDEGYR